MAEKMVLIGYNAYLAVSKIMGVFPYGGAKLRKEISQRKENSPLQKTYLQDCSKNKPIKSVIMMDDGTYILSSLSTQVLSKRISEE